VQRVRRESCGRGPQVLRPEVAADEAATTQLIYEALFVARWRQW